MRIDHWLDLASREESDTLHKFNFEREISFGAAPVTDAHAAFVAFLGTLDDSDPRSAKQILDEFIDIQAASPSSDRRFVEPAVRSDSRQVFLKTMGGDPSILDHFGFDMPLFTKIRQRIAAHLAAKDLDRDMETELQALAGRLRPPVRPATARSSKLIRLVPDRMHRGAPTAAKDCTPWWFTYEDALEAEESSLPDRSSPLQQSGYVAGLRARLGVHHKDDSRTDQDMAGDSAIAFRLFFQLATRTPDRLKSKLCQPAVFSGGFPELFVTMPRSSHGGVTVRLMDLECLHDSSCRCGSDGLPEGVVPRYVVMEDDCQFEVRSVYMTFVRDLARFRTPTCADIRAQRMTH